MLNFTFSKYYLIFIIFSCNNSTDTLSEYSRKTISCIKEKNSKLINKLDDLEHFLLKKKYIKDTSKSSYLNFIKNLDSKKIEIISPKFLLSNKNIRNILPEDYNVAPWEYGIFGECLKQLKKEASNSDYYELASNILQITLVHSLIETANRKGDFFNYNDIPEDLFENKLIHYCFLFALSQKLYGI